MIRVEDNRSLLAMANREDLHVAFTRLQKFNAYLSQAASDYRKLADRLAKLGL